MYYKNRQIIREAGESICLKIMTVKLWKRLITTVRNLQGPEISWLKSIWKDQR